MNEEERRNQYVEAGVFLHPAQVIRLLLPLDDSEVEEMEAWVDGENHAPLDYPVRASAWLLAHQEAAAELRARKA